MSRNAVEPTVANVGPGQNAALTLRLSGDPAREPPDEGTEYQSGLGRERNVRGHAYKDAEC